MNSAPAVSWLDGRHRHNRWARRVGTIATLRAQLRGSAGRLDPALLRCRLLVQSTPGCCVPGWGSSRGRGPRRGYRSVAAALGGTYNRARAAGAGRRCELSGSNRTVLSQASPGIDRYSGGQTDGGPNFCYPLRRLRRHRRGGRRRLQEQPARSNAVPRRRGIRPYPAGVERYGRQAAHPDRAVQRYGGRDQRGELRPGQRPADLGAGWRAQLSRKQRGP